MRTRAALSLLLALLVVARAEGAAACATAPPPGTTVQIAEEEAIIAWDARTHVETFIRRAAFHATGPRFGFLVPTPTTPTLDEVDAGVFAAIADALGPERVIDRSGYQLGVTSWAASCVASYDKADHAPEVAAAGPHAVRVLATAHVAGFDASTLEADDPQALAAWLAAHGFAATPALTAWLERYVTDHWKLTAFVVATDQPAAPGYDLATRAVRMTFATDRPYYPYREPATPPADDGAPAPRTLRVVFAGDVRMAATMGAAAWTARTQFARPLELPTALGLGRRFVTVFLDDSSPRRGTDEVYFAPSANTAEVRATIIREPTTIGVPLDAIGVMLIVGMYLAIHRAAGPDRLHACRLLGGCQVGDAKLTPGFRLPARHIIHTVGPKWQGGGHQERERLASCYRRALELARGHQLESIAFPAISTGIYGYPPARAAQVACATLAAELPTDPRPARVVLVAFDDDAAAHLRAALAMHPA